MAFAKPHVKQHGLPLYHKINQKSLASYNIDDKPQVK